MKTKDMADMVYNIMFLAAYLSFVIFVLILGFYGIFMISYFITIFVIGCVYFTTQFVIYLRNTKRLFFSNLDKRKAS